MWSVRDAPFALCSKSVTISKSRSEVVIQCGDCDEASRVFEWLASNEGPFASPALHRERLKRIVRIAKRWRRKERLKARHLAEIQQTIRGWNYIQRSLAYAIGFRLR
jgi:hypothetical protein